MDTTPLTADKADSILDSMMRELARSDEKFLLIHPQWIDAVREMDGFASTERYGSMMPVVGEIGAVKDGDTCVRYVVDSHG